MSHSTLAIMNAGQQEDTSHITSHSSNSSPSHNSQSGASNERGRGHHSQTLTFSDHVEQQQLEVQYAAISSYYPTPPQVGNYRDPNTSFVLFNQDPDNPFLDLVPSFPPWPTIHYIPPLRKNQIRSNLALHIEEFIHSCRQSDEGAENNSNWDTLSNGSDASDASTVINESTEISESIESDASNTESDQTHSSIDVDIENSVYHEQLKNCEIAVPGVVVVRAIGEATMDRDSRSRR